MLQRLLEQKRAITVASTECESTPPTELRAQQWTLAEKVVKMLVVLLKTLCCSLMIPIRLFVISTCNQKLGQKIKAQWQMKC